MTHVLASLSSRSRLARRVARVTLVLLCSSPTLARTFAQDANEVQRTPPPEALDHYTRGREHYQAGRYREAVIELEQARALDPASPNLVYNLARVYELLGRVDPAIANYERYRSMLPASEAAERNRVTGAIQRLRGARTELSARERDPARGPVLVRSERGVADGAFWTLASISIAALAVGTVSGALALKSERDTEAFVLGRDGDVGDRERLARRADRLSVAADVSLAAGAVGGLTSILLYALRVRPVVQPGVRAGSSGLTLTLGGAL
ncbi:MAG: tetratricopeptide repeat protein [Polyangiales bacterium]